MRYIKFIIVIIPFFLLSACSMPYEKHSQGKGVYHRVKTGENLWQIAKAYNVTLQELAEANNITDPNIVQADTVIFIPDAKEVIDSIITSAQLAEAAVGRETATKTGRQRYEAGTMKEPGIKPPVVSIKDFGKSKEGGIKTPSSTIIEEDISKKPEAAAPLKEDPGAKTSAQVAAIVPPPKSESVIEPPAKHAIEGTISSGIAFDKKRFIWPLKGKILNRFGIQPNGMYSNGIKIAAKEGTKVVAAAAGTVIFSSSIRGYGETVIIKHGDNFATVYTNLYDRTVNVEDKVKKGDKIALVGRFEKEGEAYLSFEIRQNNKARNPLFFLP